MACLLMEFSSLRYSRKNSRVMGHHTSTHCTFAMCPSLDRSSQLASYSFGPIRKLRSVIFSSSRTRVAVRPSFACDLVMEMTLRNMCAGTTCTSSMSISPHSRPWICSSTLAASSERRPLKATMLYVVTTTHARLGMGSFLSLVNRTTWSSSRVLQSRNWYRHWSTDTLDVHRHRQLFPTRIAAAIPVRDLPAPHGRTMIPERARPFPNILLRDFSWYGRSTAIGLSCAPRSAFTTSFRKSYSSSMG
mmetsp:Transcript_56890/g.180008  ORF Transcript_56890/g.180008 Transcript_56890/m.180008 type:complete len:247 (+) Transcript_56890:553-1293(+)